MAAEKANIVCRDGFELCGTLYRPALAQPRAAVLLAGAMATPQRYYRHFAAWLANQGYLVLTFDYRGTFTSQGPLGPKTPASFDVWGQQDVTAAADYLADASAHLQRFYLGHSLGGQLFPSSLNQHVFERYLCLASGRGYWPKLRTWPARLGLMLTSQFWGPLLTPLFGYFPGAKIKKVGNMPAGVIKQWQHWCRHPQYLARDGEQKARFANVSTPLTTLFSDDDEVFTEECIAFYADMTGSSDKRWVPLNARQTQAGRIGHHGFFKQVMQGDIWPAIRRELHR